MKKNTNIVSLLIIVFAVLILVLLIGGGTYLLTLSKQVQALNITPDFADTELDVGMEYKFLINATPEKASLKKVEYFCDDPSATFRAGDDGVAFLTTGLSEGTVTVYVGTKDITSNVLTYKVIDRVAQAEAKAAEEQKAAEEAAAAAEAEALAAQQAAEAAAAQVMYVQLTGDNVRVREQPNTDCSILGTEKKNAKFVKYEVIDDWTKIDYKGQEGYVKTEFLKDISEEEYNNASQPVAEEPKKEEKKPENTAPADNNAQAQAQPDANAQAQADAAAQQKALETALAAAAAAQQQQAAAAPANGVSLTFKDGTYTVSQETYNYLKDTYWHDAITSEAAANDVNTVNTYLPANLKISKGGAAAAVPAAPAVPGVAGAVTVNCTDGSMVISAAQWAVCEKYWSYTGDTMGMVGHHSKGELQNLFKLEGAH